MYKKVLLYLFIKWILIISVDSAAVKKNSKKVNIASVDYSQVPIVEKALYTPPLEEIVEVLSGGLRSTFKDVSVSVEISPDLTKSPFNLTAPGLTGAAALVEVGGQSYLTPCVHRDKLYDLAALLRRLRRARAALVGAGAGPWPYVGVASEGIVNFFVKHGVLKQGSIAVTVEPVGAAKGADGYLQQTLPASETRIAMLGNLLLSEGRRGQVIKVVAKNRTGPSNFITAIRETLKEHYGEKAVGLGGTFVLLAGRAKYHVMPDFSPVPLCSDAAVDAWLHYFDMRAPITNVGTLVTGDLGLDLRAEHFHGFSAHGDAGHYHYDITPAQTHYEGYFTLAASVVRVDAPTHTHSCSRD